MKRFALVGSIVALTMSFATAAFDFSNLAVQMIETGKPAVISYGNVKIDFLEGTFKKR